MEDGGIPEAGAKPAVPADRDAPGLMDTVALSDEFPVRDDGGGMALDWDSMLSSVIGVVEGGVDDAINTLLSVNCKDVRKRRWHNTLGHFENLAFVTYYLRVKEKLD